MPPAYTDVIASPSARAHALDSFLHLLAMSTRFRKWRRRINRRIEEVRGDIDNARRDVLDKAHELRTEYEMQVNEAVFDYAYQLGREAGLIERLPPLAPMSPRQPPGPYAVVAVVCARYSEMPRYPLAVTAEQQAALGAGDIACPGCQQRCRPLLSNVSFPEPTRLLALSPDKTWEVAWVENGTIVSWSGYTAPSVGARDPRNRTGPRNVLADDISKGAPDQDLRADSIFDANHD